MGENVLALLFTVVLLFGGVYSVSLTASPASIVNGFFSNAFSMAMKRVLSLIFKITTKAAISGRPMMKFESGYDVETVFDGSKLGIEPYAVEALPDGDLLILDSANSNLYKISSSLSLYSRPKLVSGSADGFYGHVDGKFREAKMNHPKGLAVDNRGNIYVADTDNMAIRKISDTGVTTIAGGKRVRGGGHVDGPGEDAKFSNDFDVIYIGSSCSLLIIDRGNKAIREIQLHFDDCAYQYGSGFPIGIAVLIAAGFFGYVLALLQQRVGSIVSFKHASKFRRTDNYFIFSQSIIHIFIFCYLDQEIVEANVSPSTYQKPMKSVERTSLIPTEDEQEKQEESFLRSVGRLVAQIGASATEIMGGVFTVFHKNPSKHQSQNQYHQHQKYSNSWPLQESFVILDEDEPPAVETRTPTPLKTYAFMSKDSEKMQQLRQSRAFYSGWDGDFQQQQQQQQTKKQQYHHQHRSSASQTYYEQSSENPTNEMVFGAVQEQNKQQENMVIKPLNHGFPVYDNRNIHSRVSHGCGH